MVYFAYRLFLLTKNLTNRTEAMSYDILKDKNPMAVNVQKIMVDNPFEYLNLHYSILHISDKYEYHNHLQKE